jgi:hypothetical protein
MALIGYGVNQTKKENGRPPINPGMGEARVRYMQDTYTTVTADAAGSTYEMQTPPVGSRIIDMILTSTGTETSQTLSVGDAVASVGPARYLTAQDISSVGMFRLDVYTSIGYVIGTTTLDDQIILTTAGATGGVGDVFTLTLLYVPGGDSD